MDGERSNGGEKKDTSYRTQQRTLFFFHSLGRLEIAQKHSQLILQ